MESIGKILRLSFSHSLQRLLLVPALFRQPEQTFDLLLFDILLLLCWLPRKDSNSQPTDLEAAALAIELLSNTWSQESDSNR
jgi:hypothetical protein